MHQELEFSVQQIITQKPNQLFKLNDLFLGVLVFFKISYQADSDPVAIIFLAAYMPPM